MDFRHRILFFIAPLLVGLGILLIVQSQNNGRLRIIFCDVGQGDGMLIITPGGKQVVIDGGPGRKIIDCLGQKMPFWDRKIELVVSTHAQKDHMEGLIEVLGRYEVAMVATHGIGNETAVYQAWEKALKGENTRIYTPNVGDELMLDSERGSLSRLEVLWPNRSMIDQWKVDPPKDLNETSIVLKLVEGPPAGGFCAYLTGDITKEILETLIDEACELLKISHHGSKTGTNDGILDLATPEVAVIQVGKNSFGHPTKEVLDMLSSHGVKILRNDINGVVEVESDGKSYAAISKK